MNTEAEEHIIGETGPMREQLEKLVKEYYYDAKPGSPKFTVLADFLKEEEIADEYFKHASDPDYTIEKQGKKYYRKGKKKLEKRRRRFYEETEDKMRNAPGYAQERKALDEAFGLMRDLYKEDAYDKGSDIVDAESEGHTAALDLLSDARDEAILRNSDTETAGFLVKVGALSELYEAYLEQFDEEE